MSENLREQLDLALEAQQATSEVLNAISRSPHDLQSILEMIVETSVRLCRSTAGHVRLLRDDGAYHIAAHKIDDPELAAAMIANPFRPSPESVAGRTVLAGETVHVHDVAADPYVSGFQKQISDHVRTAMSVPLKRDGEVIGVISVFNNYVRPYTDREIRLVETFADQALIAIENARLVEAVHRQAQVLKQFLSPAVADTLVKDGDEALRKSHRSLIATLFCDMRGFTAFCETAEPEETIEVLQTYHEEMGKLISAHKAGVDKRMGDGIMVIFNDPLPCDDPAGDAVRLAIAMRDCMAKLSEQWRRLGHRLGFGVGISLGYANIGMVGSEGRYDYTASGAAVNLANRLCDHAEDGEILLNVRAHNAIASNYKSVSNDDLSFKGIRDPVEVFKLVSS